MLVDNDCYFADLLLVLMALVFQFVDVFVKLSEMVLDFIFEFVMILICYFSHLPFPA